MKTRALHTYIDELGNKRTNVVWFGSTNERRSNALWDDGLWDMASWDDDKSNAILVNSFSEQQQSVIDGLTQRLSIIKSELWYAVSYGIPLFEKNRSKVEFDSWVLKTINAHPDVNSILSFSSYVNNKQYHCEVQILSTYGQIDINL